MRRLRGTGGDLVILEGLLNLAIDTLESLGYNVDYKILNAVEYGVPQTRRRLIIIFQSHNHTVPGL